MARTSSGRALGILRTILEHHQHAKIHSHSIDVQTANVLLTVYDALNEQNRAKFRRMLDTGPNNLGRLIEFSYAHVS